MAHDDTIKAGRGFVYITFAKIYFMITSAVVNLGLPTFLGSKARYGDFGTVNNFITIITMVMITGTIQAVSKLVSEKEALARHIIRRAMFIQSFIGVGLFLIVFLLADWIATDVMKDPRYKVYIQTASFIILFYSFYAIFVGTLNGLKRFFHQASLDISFSTLKTGFILVLVFMGYSVIGAFFGFVLASFLIMFISIWVARRFLPEDTPFDPRSTKRLLDYMIPIMAYTLILNLLLKVDTIFIKSLKFEPFTDFFTSPMGKMEILMHMSAPGGIFSLQPEQSADFFQFMAAESTSMLSGLFSAVKNVSYLPYQAIISIAFVIFPLISHATFVEDRDTTRSYISSTFRYTLMLIMFFCAVILSCAPEIVYFFFGKEYLVASTALKILTIATVFFGLFFVANTIITGAGYPKTVLLIGTVTFVINAVLCYIFILSSDLWEDTLTKVAIANVISMFVGLTGCIIFIRVKYKVFMSYVSLIRITAAAGIVYFFGNFFHTQSRPVIVCKCAFAAFLYLLILFGIREIKKADFEIVKKVARSKSSSQQAVPAER